MTRTRSRLPHALALVAWLLLALQSPWHAGMQAGAALAPPDYAALARSIGVNCGPRPDATVLGALVEAGALPASALAQHQAADSLTLCDLFAGLAAAVAPVLAVPPRAPAFVAASPAATRPAATGIHPLPPARGPPAAA